jgi:starch phosphorylase
MSAGPDEATTQAGIRSLHDLALDLRWSWSHVTDELWKRLEPVLWSRTRNPWVILRTVSRHRLSQMLADREFRATLDRAIELAREAEQASTWFQQSHAGSALGPVAYFSMEFMLSEALPIYSGGLGNVAGDQLRAASDLGVSVVGVSLLYQCGYFRQVIAADGSQQALFPYNDPGQLPITPLRGPDGDWLRLEIPVAGGSLWLRAWQAKVGRLQLYLLDSNDIANDPVHRGITSELYGGGPELRLQQELVLGIGGSRLLEVLDLRPEICHLNEGHAAFAVLERARTYMRATGRAFDVALLATRAGNVFTTHTAVAAGFDLFAPELIARYLGRYAEHELSIGLQDLLALGRRPGGGADEPFNMAYLAVRGSGVVNGVSELHGAVSRRIFLPLFPRRPAAEVPVGHVTNGVHTPSWDGKESDELWTQSSGKNRWLGNLEAVGERIRSVADSALWDLRTAARRHLIEYARSRLSEQLARSGASESEVEAGRRVFNPDALTLGFARRFAPYKRPNLLLRDPQRLLRILTDTQRPVQLILAGKAHPADAPGQALIREWTQFIRRADVRPHAVFLADYDMLMTEHLVQGVDVWVNTPRRPWEACGTSGMKVLVNGGLNLSELDGWWAEAYAPAVGWALGDRQEHGDDPQWDAAEASRLYELIETQIAPEFYARDEHGVPRAWIARVRESMAQLTPAYSANRSVRQYVEQCYLPASVAYRRRTADSGAVALRMAAQLRVLDQGWHTLRFGHLDVQTRNGRHEFSVEVFHGTLSVDLLCVQLYAEPRPDGRPVLEQMTLTAPSTPNGGPLRYLAQIEASRPASDYTPRIVPALPDGSVPLEAPHILWQR